MQNVKSKDKKQFRLYDIYRYLALKEESSIRGIDSYYVVRTDKNDILAVLTFENGFEVSHYCANEADLKDAVRWVNKHLGNCSIPGPKHRKGKQIRFKI